MKFAGHRESSVIELANSVFNIAKDLYNKELHMVIFAIINVRFMAGHKLSILNLHLRA